MWIWDGTFWKEVKGKVPPPRAEASIVYDSDRNRIVLFGGYHIKDGERIRLGDTWEWDGDRWEQKSSDGPPPRNGTAMAYDPYHKRVVLFWGNNDTGQTWEWDGNTWTQIPSADTEGRFNSAMAYDIKRKMLIRFGGWAHGKRLGGTWSYDAHQWTKITDEGPSPRNHTSMVYDRKRKVIVLFGGHDGDHVFGDTWEWS